jgi:hypothetical protein
MRTILYVLAVLLSLTPFAIASAQVGQDPVKFVIAPDHPGPGDTVVIEAQGVGGFLGDATITWRVNGNLVLSGVGEQKFSFTLGGLGSTNTVDVTISSPSRGVITKKFSFNPSNVYMLWEAKTSVPPFYLGKALFTGGSVFKVVAVPQVVVRGSTVSVGSLSFAWQRNGTPLPEQSGRGKNILNLTGNQLLLQETVAVDVSLNGEVVARGEVVIPVQKPQVLLYESDPLRGVLYDQALTNRASLAVKEVAFKAEPYFFDLGSLNSGSVSYEWRLNNKVTTGPETSKGYLTLRQSGNGEGSAALSVALQNLDSGKYVQTAKTALTILFGNTTSGSTQAPFGL